MYIALEKKRTEKKLIHNQNVESNKLKIFCKKIQKRLFSYFEYEIDHEVPKVYEQ